MVILITQQTDHTIVAKAYISAFNNSRKAAKVASREGSLLEQGGCPQTQPCSERPIYATFHERTGEAGGREGGRAGRQTSARPAFTRCNDMRMPH